MQKYECDVKICYNLYICIFQEIFKLFSYCEPNVFWLCRKKYNEIYGTTDIKHESI